MNILCLHFAVDCAIIPLAVAKATAISGCGAVGSALDWGSRGREFKSRHSDHNVETKKMSPAKSPNISGFFAT